MLSKTKNISNIKIILKIKKQYCIKHALSKRYKFKKKILGGNLFFLIKQKIKKNFILQKLIINLKGGVCNLSFKI